MTVNGLWGQRLRRVREALGRKILVYGNHEMTRDGHLDADGFEVHSTLYVDGDPPLLLTHVPLPEIPNSCVNIHGHLHQERVPGATRHINACVEQLRYRPRTLTELSALGKELLNVRPHTQLGNTTADQLDRITEELT